MAPTRRNDPSTASTSDLATKSSSIARKTKRKSQHNHREEDGSSPLALPGVQKIKASLRQTRRLLAKDNLAADVRTKTERRLKSLEADLAQAERVRRERTMSARYHAVKFFERQKITRRIQQVKRQLSQADTPGKGKADEKLGKKERRKLEKKLEELRVDLNYIIHYPKLKKYISLFPPDIRSQSHAHPDPYPHSYPESSDSRPEKTASQTEKDTDAQREEVRARVRERMTAGEMSSEPEVEVRSGKKSVARPIASTGKGVDGTAPAEPSTRQENGATSETRTKGHAVPHAARGVAGDAFFGDDDAGSDEETGTDNSGQDTNEGGDSDDMDDR